MPINPFSEEGIELLQRIALAETDRKQLYTYLSHEIDPKFRRKIIARIRKLGPKKGLLKRLFA